MLANTGIVNAWELYGCEEVIGVIGVGALFVRPGRLDHRLASRNIRLSTSSGFIGSKCWSCDDCVRFGMYRTSLCLRRFDLARSSWQQYRPTIVRRTKRHHRACETVRAYSAAAKDKDKEELLRGVSVESREDVARILEQAQKADAAWSTVYTDFYTPPVISDATAVIKKLTGVTCKAWGGYAQAERARLIVTKAEMIDVEDNQV